MRPLRYRAPSRPRLRPGRRVPHPALEEFADWLRYATGTGTEQWIGGDTWDC